MALLVPYQVRSDPTTPASAVVVAIVVRLTLPLSQERLFQHSPPLSFLMRPLSIVSPHHSVCVCVQCWPGCISTFESVLLGRRAWSLRRRGIFLIFFSSMMSSMTTMWSSVRLLNYESPVGKSGKTSYQKGLGRLSLRV